MRHGRGTPSAVAAASLMLLALGLVGACSHAHRPPLLSTRNAATGTLADFAGIAITVPSAWRVLAHSPASCGSVVGQSAYFYVGSDSPPPGCASSPPTGPYLSIECHPYGSAPTGPTTQVGPFDAVVQRGPGEVSMYLSGRDTVIFIYGMTEVVTQTESSIGKTSGTC
jgi:hypothetical protein